MDSKFLNDLLFKCDEFPIDIFTAASIGYDECMREIIENSENKSVVNECNKKKWTPLMYAACCANLKIVLLLLEEGAETNLENCEGHTALILASKCGSVDIVNLLIDNGAEVNLRDFKGWTALFHAVAFGHRGVAQLLIERGAVLQTMDRKHRVTPLMLAAAAGHEMIVKDLLQTGIDVNIESISGDTAKSLALKNGHINVKNLIEPYCYTVKKNIDTLPNVRCQDLFLLLKDLELTKYYHVFENHDIDLNTFWLLTDENLKEIGIKLLGPRKKMCVTISRYHNERSINSSSKDVANIENIMLENKQLLQLAEKMKSFALHEKNLRLAAEKNLSDHIQSFKNYSDAVQIAVSRTANFADRIIQSHEYLRSLLCCNLHDINSGRNGPKAKFDLIMQSLDCIQKLINLQHQNILSLQNLDFKKYMNR